MENENLIKNINIVVGSIIILLSIIVLFYGTAALISLILLLAIAFLFMGIGRLFNAYSNTLLNKLSKYIKYSTGFISIIVSIAVLVITIVNPSLSILILINLFGYVLIIIGVARIAVGYLMELYPIVYRVFLVIVGILTFVFAFIVLLFPILGYFILVTLVSLSLLVNGLARVLFGIVVKKIKA